GYIKQKGFGNIIIYSTLGEKQCPHQNRLTYTDFHGLISALFNFPVMQILVTGGAGFIGSHVVDALLAQDHQVVIVDNFNAAYPPEFKRSNVNRFGTQINLHEADISKPEVMDALVRRYRPQQIIHLAARSGVRASQLIPNEYIQSNIVGTANVLKAASDFGVRRVIISSSSQVYGNIQPPFSEEAILGKPLSVYAATKQSLETLVQQYVAHGLPVTMFRFFTVYGERGRPDMAPYIFTQALFQQQPITLFGDGSQLRDFTYVKDIVDGILRAVIAPIAYPVMNLGHNQPVKLIDFIQTLERLTGKTAQLIFAPARTEEMPVTWANIFRAKQYLGWEPTTSLDVGLEQFVDWFKRERA
ncbi:MAG: NAD-dependent epimerase/dehydratase family protein, partial [Patescibacteria group bacterium]